MKIFKYALTLAMLSLAVWTTIKNFAFANVVNVESRSSGELLLNGNFSQADEGTELPDHWQVKGEKGSRVRFTLEEEGARSAPTALKISIEQGTARLQQTLPNVPLAPALLSGYARVPTSEQKVQGVLQVFGETNDEPMQTILVPITSSTQWKRFQQRLLLPQTAKRALLCFEAHGQGEVWLDDITLLPATIGGNNTPNEQ